MLHFSVCIFVYFGIFRFVLLQGAASNFVEHLMFNDNKKDSDFPF